MKKEDEGECPQHHLCEPILRKIEMSPEQRVAMAHYLNQTTMLGSMASPKFRQSMADAMVMTAAMLCLASERRLTRAEFVERAALLFDYQAVHDVPTAKAQA